MIFVKHFEQTTKFNELALFVQNPVARSSKLSMGYMQLNFYDSSIFLLIYNQNGNVNTI